MNLFSDLESSKCFTNLAAYKTVFPTVFKSLNFLDSVSCSGFVNELVCKS